MSPVTRHPCRLALAWALLAACDALAQPGTPVDAALRHLDASFKSRCAEVWASYTKATQERIRNAVHRRERERAGAPTGDTPETAYCGRSGRLKRGSARIESQQGEVAVVTVIVLDRISRFRHDLFPPESELTVRLNLVREAGAWRIDRPQERKERDTRTLVEVGAVDVHVGAAVRGLHQRIEATMVSRAPRAALDSVLRDPKAWAMVLPSFAAVEPLEPAGGIDRVRLAFEQPAPAMPFTAQVSSPRDAMDSRTRQWAVEGDTKAPAYMRGRWDLTPHVDGTSRITLTLVIDPRQWPGEHFSAERLGKAVVDFEKAALAQPR